MVQKPDRETLNALNANVTDEFRANAGKVGGRFEGNELLLLTTTGAKSGEPRVGPLVAFRIEGRLLIVAGYGGADVNPAWVHNLRANPRAHVEAATGSFEVVARELDPSERETVIPRINATMPALAYANYQSKPRAPSRYLSYMRTAQELSKQFHDPTHHTMCPRGTWPRTTRVVILQLGR